MKSQNAEPQAKAALTLSLKDLRRLRVGDKMTWEGKEDGEISEVGNMGVRIKWSDGQATTLFFNDVKSRVSNVLERLAKIGRASK